MPSVFRHASRPQSIAWFQDHYKDGRLELRPPFQRKPVWSDKQRNALIESLLMDVPIPEVYVHVTVSENGTEQFGVVDGQQRLRTVLQFVGLERTEDQHDADNNNFSLSALPAQSKYFDKSFRDIVGDARQKFYQYEICVRFLYTEDIRIIEDVFKRLNKYTMPLKAQELRNATYHGAFAKLSEDFADDEYWAVNRIVTPMAIRRMADIEMMSDLLIGLLHGPQGGAAKTINDYYEQYEQYDDEFPDQPRITRLFMRCKATISRLFPKIADTRWGNRADYYSLFVALGELQEKKELPKSKDAEIRGLLLALATEVDEQVRVGGSKKQGPVKYAAAIEKGSNDKARRMDRHEVIVSLLQSFITEKK
jgi:Protein of unknown function DUF262